MDTISDLYRIQLRCLYFFFFCDTRKVEIKVVHLYTAGRWTIVAKPVVNNRLKVQNKTVIRCIYFQNPENGTAADG